MNATRNPDTMTPAERDAEVASILSRGLIRAVRIARERSALDIDNGRECRDSGLELLGHGGVSVATRPAG